MRAIACLVLLLALASPALAAETETNASPVAAASLAAAPQVSPVVTPTAAAHADAAPDEAMPGDTAKAHAKHKHAKWEDKFAKADTAHNGHLTLQEAENGYPTVARHFQEIDVDSKGYVTLNDIRAWHALRKASHAHHQKSDDALRPQHAFQQRPATSLHPLNTRATQTIQPPATARVAGQSEAQR